MEIVPFRPSPSSPSPSFDTRSVMHPGSGLDHLSGHGPLELFSLFFPVFPKAFRGRYKRLPPRADLDAW